MDSSAHPGRRDAVLFICRDLLRHATGKAPGAKSVMHRDPKIIVKFKGNVGKFAMDIAFEAPLRGITAVFGPSGSGKTTVLRFVSGLSRLPGELMIGDEVWQDQRGTFLRPHQRATGYVFQEASLFPHLSVRKNLLYGHQ